MLEAIVCFPAFNYNLTFFKLDTCRQNTFSARIASSNHGKMMFLFSTGCCDMWTEQSPCCFCSQLWILSLLLSLGIPVQPIGNQESTRFLMVLAFFPGLDSMQWVWFTSCSLFGHEPSGLSVASYIAQWLQRSMWYVMCADRSPFML